MKFIKIENTDGKFSRGGRNPSFSKKGKTWSTLSYVKRHFSLLTNEELIQKYDECFLVTIDDIDMTKSTEPLSTIIREYIVSRHSKKFTDELNRLRRMQTHYLQESKNFKAKAIAAENKINEMMKV